MRRVSVLLLDASESLAIPFAHALSLTGRYRVAALSADARHPLRHSWRTRFVWRGDWRWDRGPEQLPTPPRGERPLLMPITTDAVAWTVDHRRALAPAWRLPALPDAAALELARDKLDLAEFAARQGIPVPRTRALAAPDVARALTFPALIKPRRRGGGVGIAAVADAAALALCRRTLPDADGYLVQSRIAGDDVSCGMLCRDGAVIAAVAYRGLTRDGEFNAFRSIEVVRDDAMLALARRLLAALRWNGLANLDWRRGPDGGLWLLEINPRPWGNLRGALAGGINFADLWCRTALGEPVRPALATAGRFLTTMDAIALLRRALRAGRGPWPSWRHSGLRFACRDPWMHVVNFRRHRGARGLGELWRHVRDHQPPELSAGAEAPPWRPALDRTPS